ncbi:MAG: nucleotide exchange factor GrpE [Candidatus Gracilibacteria bacterium]|nr:nucleotide exchange factor GrpE [Candidatus Gracilibacteria bacterium]
MTKNEKDEREEQDIVEEMQEEITEMEDTEEEILEEENESGESEVDKLKDSLTRAQADFVNFKQRVERDKNDMIFFLKSDILKKILPRVDDLERIIKNTPSDLQEGALFEGIISLQTKLLSDLDKMGVTTFDSKGEEVDPNKHDVMTTVPGQEEGIICDEFEKGYLLGDKVLRHAKVVVGA